MNRLFFSSFALVCFLAGCNVVLGIDEAELAQEAGGDGGSAGTGGTGGSSGGTGGLGGTTAAGGTGGSIPAGVCELSGEACWDCTATACCGEYEDCAKDSVCSSALAKYNDCLAAPPAGGNTCAELSSALSGKFLTLSKCVFLSQCGTVCDNYSLGNLCDPYCDCMDSTCPTFIDDRDACRAFCPSLSLDQVRCRALHCTFAKSDVDLHCPHAVGIHFCP
jgi:hypothetical protein